MNKTEQFQGYRSVFGIRRSKFFDWTVLTVHATKSAENLLGTFDLAWTPREIRALGRGRSTH